MSFVSALDDEISEIEASIAFNPDPRYAKLEELRRIRASFYSEAAPASRKLVVEPNARNVLSHIRRPEEGTAGPSRVPGRRMAPEREAALRAAADYIKGKTEPVKTAEIYEMLTILDIGISGTDPKSNLSAMMSNSPIFTSHGRLGWTLAEGEAE